MSLKKLVLGLDTGGTHTDAVVFDPASRAVLASAKAETTHHDLSQGLARALTNLAALSWPGGLRAVERIHLSTTLATNAIAENLGVPVGLILIGYDPDLPSVRALTADLPLTETVFVAGGHDYYGRQEAELDEETVLAAARELDGRVLGWAVSAMFSMKNPDHELRAAQLIRQVSSRPATLGRDLTGRYDAVRRAATAALNAGLVPIIERLLDAVALSAARAGFQARLMVVKGDGTLVSESWAREKPIETVVSGPAASLLGARVLGRGLTAPGQDDLWVLDVGGTTTDLAYVEAGRPVVNPDGARVGRWNTMTTTVETRTRGLGGDSLVAVNYSNGQLTLGPRRVRPLCRLAVSWPHVEQTLRSQKVMGAPATLAGIFFLPGPAGEAGMSREEKSLREALLPDQPLPLARYAHDLARDRRRFPGLSVIQHPAVEISAFTPTDAMSILGLYQDGVREAAVLGAEILGRGLKMGAEEMARMVLEEFGRLLAQEVAAYGLGRAGLPDGPEYFEPGGVFSSALGRAQTPGVAVEFRATSPVFLLGAPAGTLAPFLSRRLKGNVMVPPVFDKASAAGAAAAPISLSRVVEIHALPNRKGYRLFLPDRSLDGWSVDSLAEMAEKIMTEYLRELARLAGAENPALALEREDRQVTLPNGRIINLGAVLRFRVEDNF